MIAAGQRAPHLAAILVGHDGGSETYVANKVNHAENADSARRLFVSRTM